VKFPPVVAALLAITVLALPGCGSLATRKKNKPPRAQPVHPERPVSLGHIILVNEDAQFVLVDASDRGLPAERAEVRVMRKTTEIARLRVTEARKRPLFVADILSGEPAKGDEVFQ
jgi:hypothetical protein